MPLFVAEIADKVLISSQSHFPLVNPTNGFTSLSPSKSLIIFYFNARILLPKFDDLLLFCASHSPDIICVVETWLSPEISDSEVSIPNYLLFRLDCSRHSGGIAVFVKSNLSVSPLPLVANLEFLPLLFTSHHYSFTLGTFYKPPNSDTAFGLFKDHISFLSPTILHNLILVGDFNIDLLKSSLSKSLIDFTNCLGLNQIICEPTHFSHSGSPSLIDLVFVSSDLSCPSRVLPPISSSDHLFILLSLPLVRKDPDLRPTNGRKVWLYNKADFYSANLLLSSIPWKSLDSQTDVNYSWFIFKEIFLDVMKHTIPSKLDIHHTSPPLVL